MLTRSNAHHRLAREDGYGPKAERGLCLNSSGTTGASLGLTDQPGEGPDVFVAPEGDKPDHDGEPNRAKSPQSGRWHKTRKINRIWRLQPMPYSRPSSLNSSPVDICTHTDSEHPGKPDLPGTTAVRPLRRAGRLLQVGADRPALIATPIGVSTLP